MTQIKLEIKRPEGNLEIVDVTKKFGLMNKTIFNQIKKSTAEAGRGNVIKAITIIDKSNVMELRKQYNDLHNEGGDGYIPDEIEYWKESPDYKEYQQIETIE